MLELRNIKKDYPAGGETVHALRGISLQFRENQFVSILGPSGCGKTTMLNIIGGLDQYTDGDLIINGKSTKDFKDRDWDTYRNHSVGFGFQAAGEKMIFIFKIGIKGRPADQGSFTQLIDRYFLEGLYVQKLL